MPDLDILRPRNSGSSSQNRLNLNYDALARDRSARQLELNSARQRAQRQDTYTAETERNLRSYRQALGEVDRLRARGEAPGEILRAALRDGGFNATPRPRAYQPTTPDRITPAPPASLTPARSPTPTPPSAAETPGGAAGRRNSPTLGGNRGGSAASAIPALLLEAAPLLGDAAGRLASYLAPSVIPPSIPALQRASDRLSGSLSDFYQDALDNLPPDERVYDQYPIYRVTGSISGTGINIFETPVTYEIDTELHGPISFAPGLVKTQQEGTPITRIRYFVTSHGSSAFPRRANSERSELVNNYARSDRPITVTVSMQGLGENGYTPIGEPFNPVAPDQPGNPQPARSPSQTQPAPQQRPQPPYAEPSIGRPGLQPSNPAQPGNPAQPNQPGILPPAIPLVRPVGGGTAPQQGGSARPGGGRPTPRFPFPGGRPVGGSTGSAVNTGVQNSIRTASSQGIPVTTNINACDAGGGDPCQVRLDRTTNDTNNRVRDLQDRLSQAADAANTAANAAILAKLDIINAKLGPQIPGGGIGNFIKKMWDSMVVQKILNILTFVTVLHNAYMLSSNLSQTLFSAFDNILEFFGAEFKDANGQDVSTSQWAGNAIEGFFNGIFGTETVNGIQANWKKFNRIYQAASNILSSFQSMIFSVLESLEVVGNYVALIGNASKKFGVFTEKCYRWMNPNLNFTTNKYFNALNNVQEAVESIDEVTGEALNIQQTGAELFNQQAALKTAVEEVIPGDQAGKDSSNTDTPQHLPSSTFESKLIAESQKVRLPIPDTAEVRQEPNG